MRSITFNGKNSLADFGVTIDSERSKIGDPEPRYLEESLPYRDGKLELGFADGKLHYDNRPLTYCFNIIGKSKIDVESRRSDIFNWLLGTMGDLYDTDFPGQKFTGVKFKPGTLEYTSRNFRCARYTINASADPYKVSDITKERRL